MADEEVVVTPEETTAAVTETLRRGLEDIYAAEILSDDNGTDGYTTGTPFKLFPAGEMSRQVSSDSNEVYFDNGVFYKSGKEGTTEINLSGASLRPDKRAEILGKHIDSTTGAMLDDGEYVEKYYALGGTTNNVDGTKELFWFAKGTFEMSSRSDKTKDDSTDTNGDELVYKAIKTQHKFTVDNESKPHKRTVIDTAITKVKSNQDWYAQVVTPDNVTTVCEKLSSSS